MSILQVICSGDEGSKNQLYYSLYQNNLFFLHCSYLAYQERLGQQQILSCYQQLPEIN